MDLIKKETLIKEDDDSNEKCCIQCKATKTPLWRIGPAGPRTLCNACGIKYRKADKGVRRLNKTSDRKNKKLESESESESNPSSPSNARTPTKSAVPSGSSTTKLGTIQKRLAWRLNSSPLRLRRKLNDKYKPKNSPPSSTTTTTTTATVVKNGDATNIRKSLKIGLRGLGKEVELLQRQRSSTVGRKRRINEEEEAAALLISLSTCGTVLA